MLVTRGRAPAVGTADCRVMYRTTRSCCWHALPFGPIAQGIRPGKPVPRIPVAGMRAGFADLVGIFLRMIVTDGADQGPSPSWNAPVAPWLMVTVLFLVAPSPQGPWDPCIA